MRCITEQEMKKADMLSEKLSETESMSAGFLFFCFRGETGIGNPGKTFFHLAQIARKPGWC